MAYKKSYNNFRSRAGSYGRRAGGYAKRAAYTGGRYAKRAGGYVKKYQTKANQGFGPAGFKIYPDLPLAGGIVVGLSNLDRQIPGELILAAAAAPIGGKYGRSIRNFAGGIILGELISKFAKISIPFPALKKTASVGAFYA